MSISSGSSEEQSHDSSNISSQLLTPQTESISGDEPFAPWPTLIPISAHTTTSLIKKATLLQGYLADHPERLRDVVHTLSLGRVSMSQRSYAVVRSDFMQPVEFRPGQLATLRSKNCNDIVFAFTGQGAQWAGMAQTLLEASPSFLSDIRDMDASLQCLKSGATWTIEGLLRQGSQNPETMKQAAIVQPLCTAIQIALVNFLSKCSINPGAVIGHSSGEIAAAYAAGGLTQSEAIICAFLRGQAVGKLTRKGSMAAVGLSSSDMAELLVDGAQIACENGPSSVTISGDEETVRKSMERVETERPGSLVKLLPLDVAYHSSK